MTEELSYVGKRLVRPDVAAKATGAAIYGADLVLPGVVVDQLFGLEEQYNHLSEGRVVILTR